MGLTVIPVSQLLHLFRLWIYFINKINGILSCSTAISSFHEEELHMLGQKKKKKERHRGGEKGFLIRLHKQSTNCIQVPSWQQLGNIVCFSYHRHDRFHCDFSLLIIGNTCVVPGLFYLYLLDCRRNTLKYWSLLSFNSFFPLLAVSSVFNAYALLLRESPIEINKWEFVRFWFMSDKPFFNSSVVSPHLYPYLDTKPLQYYFLGMESLKAFCKLGTDK